MSDTAIGELVGRDAAPHIELSYVLKFPDSRVYAVDGRGMRFRITEVCERLFTRMDGTMGYSVWAGGPRQTKAGVDHRSVKGGEMYDGTHFRPLSDLPAAVIDYLHGQDRMRRMEGIPAAVPAPGQEGRS